MILACGVQAPGNVSLNRVRRCETEDEESTQAMIAVPAAQ